MEENFKPYAENAMRSPILYGDYRTALEESEPRLYEDIQDYDACKALFQEVLLCFFKIQFIVDIPGCI